MFQPNLTGFFKPVGDPPLIYSDSSGQYAEIGIGVIVAWVAFGLAATYGAYALLDNFVFNPPGSTQEGTPVAVPNDPNNAGMAINDGPSPEWRDSGFGPPIISTGEGFQYGGSTGIWGGFKHLAGQWTAGAISGHRNFLVNSWNGITRGIPQLLNRNLFANNAILSGDFESGYELHKANASTLWKGLIAPFKQIGTGFGHLSRGEYFEASMNFTEAGDSFAMAIATEGAGRALGAFSRTGRAASASGQSFRSFSAFKRAMGPAGKGKAWHHIVEQNPANIAKFGGESIHTTSNLMKLPHGAGTIHARISGHYSSIQGFTGGRTVRQWLNTKSFDFQRNYGLQKLKEFGSTH